MKNGSQLFVIGNNLTNLVMNFTVKTRSHLEFCMSIYVTVNCNITYYFT